MRRLFLVVLFFVGTALFPSALASAADTSRDRLREMLRQRLADSTVDRPLLHAQQIASLERVHYRPYAQEGQEALAVELPDEGELARFAEAREGVESEALDLLDEFYGTREGLKALAVRDRDGDGIPDYRVSDYYGKFSEGDVDVDGDGVRNLYDDHPYDPSKGGGDSDGDGTPDRGFADRNENRLPDHVDWGLHKNDPVLAEIQLGLFRDHGILLVERDAEFDLPLALAADDAVRRVFRAYFEKNPVLPTLRTIAVEKTALLNALVALLAEDETSAQVFSQTQSLTVYDPGRDVEDALGLLGLFAHEIGHSYHMSLDWDASHPDLENRRTSFPAPRFVETVEPFGWTTSGMLDGRFGEALPVLPLFLYTGMAEPAFLYEGRDPEEWDGWLNAIYEELGSPEDYLEHSAFVGQAVVGDYSLTTPYEWYGDNLLAYVVTQLEQAATKKIAASEAREARLRIVASLRAIWPAFDHRNMGKEALAYFRETFPIREDDLELLVARYIDPILTP